MALTLENYNRGVLIDDDLMGGVTLNPDAPDQFVAYVLQHTTGEYLGYQSFAKLEDALQAINRVQRSWKYEQTGGCGGGKCGKGGCKGGNCGLGVRGDRQTGRAPCESGACPS